VLAESQAGGPCPQAAGGGTVEDVCVLGGNMGVRMLRGRGEQVLHFDRGAGGRLTVLLRVGGVPRVREPGRSC